MTAAEIGDPTGDTRTGAVVTVKEVHRDSIIRTAQDSVADVVELETGTTSEAAVRGGAMVQTPTPPTKTGRKFGVAVRTIGKEVGRCRINNGLGDGDMVRRSASASSQRETVSDPAHALTRLCKDTIATQ